MNKLKIMFSFLISLLLIIITFFIELFVYKQKFFDASIFSFVCLFPFIIIFLQILFGKITDKKLELNKYFMIKNALVTCLFIFIGIKSKNHLCIVGASFVIQSMLGYYAGLFCRKNNIKDE